MSKVKARRWAAAIALLVGLSTLPVVGAAPAVASEVFARPASGVWTVSGHGFGHGHGMSAWGSYGAAAQGVDWTAILSFYYPGTVRTQQGNPGVRVKLTTDSTQARVSGVDGLRATDGSGYSTILPSGVSQWRMVPSLKGFHLEALTDAWRVVPLNGQTEITTFVRFDSPTGVLRAWKSNGNSVDYRGALFTYPSGSSVTSILQTTVEDYLRGVVSRESVPSWPANALRAQATASRSIASYFRSRPAGSLYDICDTTQCQVFGGIASYSAGGTRTGGETTSTDAAVRDTGGVVLTYQGAVAVTQYSSSSGGWTTDGGLPYLVAQADPWDGSAPGDSLHTWSATLRVTDLERAFPSIGTLQTLTVDQRDGHGEWGGRVLAVTLTGTQGSVRTTGVGIMNARPYPAYSDGVRSSWWTLDGGASSGPPIGQVDSVGWQGGSARVRGWAIDPDVAAPVDVHVYVDGVNSAVVSASGSRPDVGAVYPAYGSNHGYDVSVPVGPGSHTVCVYAINVPAPAVNPQLGCRTVVVSGLAPIGQVDSVGWDGGSARVRGWAIDPDVAAPVDVHVYVDGVNSAVVSASGSRPDVGAVYPAYGSNHGYDVSVPVGPGSHTVCVYAINVPAPAVNPQLGCRTVVVSGLAPIGQVDSVGRDGGSARVRGWAIDPDVAAPGMCTCTWTGCQLGGGVGVGVASGCGCGVPGVRVEPRV